MVACRLAVRRGPWNPALQLSRTTQEGALDKTGATKTRQDQMILRGDKCDSRSAYSCKALAMTVDLSRPHLFYINCIPCSYADIAAAIIA